MWRLTEQEPDRRMEPLKLYESSSPSGEPSSQSAAPPWGYFTSTSAASMISRRLYGICVRTAMPVIVSLFLCGASAMLASQTLRFALRLTSTSGNFSSPTQPPTASRPSTGGASSSDSTRRFSNPQSEE